MIDLGQAFFWTAGLELITFPRPKCQLFGFQMLISLPEYSGEYSSGPEQVRQRLSHAATARSDQISTYVCGLKKAVVASNGGP